MRPPLILALGLLAASAAIAQPRWTELATGHDLNGWKIVARSNPAPVAVEDGAFVLRQRRNTTEHTFLTSVEKYRDFILELDLKDDPGFNTGILLRCADAPADAHVRLNGYQVKIDPTTRAWTGGVFDDYGADWKWMFDLKNDARARGAFKLGQWAHFRIECLGSAIKVWVNGVPTCNLIDDRYRAGYIAFKIHAIGDNPNAGQNAVRIKNVRIITDDATRYAQAMDIAPRRAPPAPDANDGDIVLPDGFRATVVADNLMAGRKDDTLRFLAVAPNGDLYAATRKGGIFALRDTDGDGRADEIQEFGSGGGTGVALHNGWLYFSSASAVYRYKYTPGVLVPQGQPELIAQLPVQKVHDAKAFAFDPQGNLYVDVGAPSNASGKPDRALGSTGVDPAELQRQHGGIWRFKGDAPQQDQLRDGYRFASGMRHVLSLAWNPVKQGFFLVMMGRDQLNTVAPQSYSAKDNAELPAEEMHFLPDHADLGWPYTYYDPLQHARMVAPEWGGDGHKRAEPGKYPEPLVAFPAHWAPMQMAFNTSQQFPNHYLNGAFIAFHGSWNRGPEPQRGYCVGFVPFGPDGMPRGNYEIFADGFAGRDLVKTPNEARFRPCGLAFGPDGTLFVADSEKGRIWRIVYTGEPHPRGAKLPGQALTAGSVAASPSDPGPQNHGAQLYLQYCAACHMPDGSGVSGMQPALAGSAVVAGDRAVLIRTILFGPAKALPADRPKFTNEMPPFGPILSDSDVASIVDYVRAAFGPHTSAADVKAMRTP